MFTVIYMARLPISPPRHIPEAKGRGLATTCSAPLIAVLRRAGLLFWPPQRVSTEASYGKEDVSFRSIAGA